MVLQGTGWSKEVAIANRTGMLGQVFHLRTAGAHAFYDLFVSAVKWELAVPLFLGVDHVANLNLEGEGQPDRLPSVIPVRSR